MFKPVGATSIDDYIGMLTSERREVITTLHEFIQNSAPDLAPHFAYNMLGYGSFRYQNYKKELIDWPIVALASQKNYISVYVCSLENGHYLAEIYKDKLGRVSVGKSCIRFKKLSDINLDALKEIIQKAAKAPGLVG
jgi:uncharacterized protein YdhG (YjbR/CyaY superfamily)